MRSGGGKQKGASFERDTCRRLSLWVSHGKREDLFWRSAMSGGRATIGNKRGINLAAQAGDISSVDKAGHVLTCDFYIETKHVKYIGLDTFIIKNSGPLAKYWKTTYREASNYEKFPILIIRQNRLPTLLLCGIGNRELFHNIRLSDRKKYKAKIYLSKSLDCELWLFDDILNTPFNYAEPML